MQPHLPRNYNLQRHLQKDIDCATTTNQTTPIICVHLLNTLLMVCWGGGYDDGGCGKVDLLDGGF